MYPTRVISSPVFLSFLFCVSKNGHDNSVSVFVFVPTTVKSMQVSVFLYLSLYLSFVYPTTVKSTPVSVLLYVFLFVFCVYNDNQINSGLPKAIECKEKTTTLATGLLSTICRSLLSLSYVHGYLPLRKIIRWRKKKTR